MSEINKSYLLNIKSAYIIKEIFSFLEQKKKLKIVLYSKRLKKKIEIGLKDYQRITGRYRLGDKNGKGEEHLIENDKLVFEGEYKNGRREGYGKEYYEAGYLEYEGEYKNGKRNGKGKEYYIYTEALRFEGEYVNGARHGKGKEYYETSNKLMFEGEYKNGKRNGFGKEYELKGSRFEGEFLNDIKWTGKSYDKKGKLKFELKNGSGYMEEYFESGQIKYKGDYKNGQRNGKGKEYTSNGNLSYEGEFKDGKRNGKGIIYGYDCDFLDSNVLYEGEFLNGEKNGKGKEYENYEQGEYSYFEGDFINGKRLNGKVCDTFGNVKYEIKDGEIVKKDKELDKKNEIFNDII